MSEWIKNWRCEDFFQLADTSVTRYAAKLLLHLTGYVSSYHMLLHTISFHSIYIHNPKKCFLVINSEKHLMLLFLVSFYEVVLLLCPKTVDGICHTECIATRQLMHFPINFFSGSTFRKSKLLNLKNGSACDNFCSKNKIKCHKL